MNKKQLTIREFREENPLKFVKCCATCIHSKFGYEGDIDCNHPMKFEKENDDYDFINQYTICKKYKKDKDKM